MKRMKSASKDFSKDDLPSNRFEVFFDVIRNRWRTLLGVGCVFFLFMLPLLVVSLAEALISVQLLGESQDGIIDAEMLQAYMQMTYTITGMIKMIAFGIFSVGISGGVRVIKRLIWAEGIHFSHDFAMGIRENWKKMFLLFLFVGGILMIEKTAPYILSGTSGLSDTEYTLVRSLITAVSILILLPIGAFVFSQIVFYENRMLTMVKNSIAFCGKTLLGTYGVIMAIYLPYKIIIHFCSVQANIMANSIFCVVLLPLVIMIWLLYSASVFDKLVNPQYYPDIVDKGIWRKEKSGEEYR